MICKFWIQPVALARNQGFAAKELNTIREDHHEKQGQDHGGMV